MPEQMYYGTLLLPEVQSTKVGQSFRAEGTDTPATHGGRPPRRLNLEGRGITVEGVIQLLPGETYDTLQDKWADFVSAHHNLASVGLVPLKIREGWFIYAYPESIEPSQSEFGYILYNCTYRCYKPFFLSNTPFTQNYVGGGAITINSTTKVEAALTVTIVTTSASGTVTITNTLTGKQMILTINGAGTYVVDAYSRKVFKGPAFADEQLSGKFLNLRGSSAGTDNILSIAYTGSPTITSIEFSWRNHSL